MMDPNVGLLAASGLVNFLLKTTVEFVVCLLLVRIAGTARSRFNLWLTMLLAFVAQWIWMLAGVARAALPASVAAVSGAAGMPAAVGKRIAIAAPMAGTVAQGIVVLLAAYAVILAWRTMGTLAARIRLARAMRYKSAPDGRIAETFQEVVEQASGLGREVRGSELWVLPGLTSPATLGWLRPRVIVPPACQTQDEAELKTVFWHELKHVERRDALWNALVRACRDLLWFHPAVHHAIRELSAQRELACDAAVVHEHPQSRDVYATCLLRFARAEDLAPEPAIPTIEMASSAALLTMRVKSILSEGGESAPGPFSRTCRGAANVALVGLMAATVPGLNILFAAQQSAAAGRPTAVTAGELHAAGKRRAWTSASGKSGETKNVASLAAMDGVAPATAALPHDEALAAEHQAAMGILTESSGMDEQAAEDGRRVSGISGDVGRRPSLQSPTAWTNVAVDAAERIALASGGNDHDADDRH